MDFDLQTENLQERFPVRPFEAYGIRLRISGRREKMKERRRNG